MFCVCVFYLTITFLYIPVIIWIRQKILKIVKLFSVFNGFCWIRICIIWYGLGFQIQQLLLPIWIPDPANYWYGSKSREMIRIPRIQIRITIYWSFGSGPGFIDINFEFIRLFCLFLKGQCKEIFDLYFF